MKLQDLFENTNLTPTDVWHAQKEHLIVDVQHAGAIYVITDIRPISKEQLQKLHKASFEPGSLNKEWIPVLVDPVNNWDNLTASHNEPGNPQTSWDTDDFSTWGDEGWDDWYEWLKHSFDRNTIKIKAITWRELVAYLKENWPEDLSDFGK